MGIILKKSIFNTVFSYLGVALGAVSTIFLFPNFLSTDQYGLTRLIISITVIAGQFGGLGIRNIMIRYFPLFRKDSKNYNGALFFASLLSLFGMLICFLVFYLGEDLIIRFYGDGDPFFVQYYNYIFAFLAITILFELFSAYLRALLHTSFTILSRDVIQRIGIIIILILFNFEILNFEEFFLWFTLAHAIPVFLIIGYVIYLKEFRIRPNFSFLRKKLLSSIGNYGLFAILGGMTSIIVGNIDVVMLGALRGLSDISVYAVAFYIGTVVAIPQKAIYQIAIPIVSKAIKNKDLDEISSIYTKSSSVQILSGVMVFSLIWINLDSIYYFLPEAYQSGTWIILIIGLSKLFDMATGINGGIILMSRFYRFDFYTGIFLIIISIVTNLFLIPELGILGAAIATAISIFLYNTLKVFYVWKKFGIHPFRANDLLVIFAALIAFGITMFIPDMTFWLTDILIRSATLVVVFLGLVFLMGLSTELIDLWKQFKPTSKNTAPLDE